MKKVIPCLFTSGNLGFGVLSIMLTSQGYLTWGAVCILLAMVCDALDGRTARALGVQGEFRQGTGFPVGLSYPLGRRRDFLIYSYSLHELGWIGMIPPVLYACCGGLRLARFNLNTTVVHGYFQGMPIPNGGCIVATYVLSGVHLPAWIIAILTSWPWAIIWSARSIIPISKAPAPMCCTNRPWPSPSSAVPWSSGW
jgi:CDP-diacylglycerol--serine O-phosphatidyltransferase